MLEAVTLILFPWLMAFAASTDLLTMTISNRISLALLAGFVVIAALAGLPVDQLLLNISCGGAMLVLTFCFFSFGWIGGGDAKLAAATAVWLGWTHILEYGLLASLLGGALTLAILQMRKMPMPRWAMAREWIARLHNSQNGVPYGIALAVAGLLLYPQTLVWQAALG
jgi:prepilin peptidase CpaA